jgi:hypothetical protein
MLLVVEVIMKERCVNPDALRHVPERYTVKPILGEEVLGRIKDLFNAFGPLFRLASARTLFPGS